MTWIVNITGHTDDQTDDERQQEEALVFDAFHETVASLIEEGHHVLSASFSGLTRGGDLREIPVAKKEEASDGAVTDS